MFMSNKTVVLAIFNDEASADMAAASLKGSGVAKGDAIGVLVLDEKGKIKADKVGKLTDLGGTTEAHEVSDEALEEARTAAATDES